MSILKKSRSLKRGFTRTLSNKVSGFTLIELLVVIAVIAVITSLIIGYLSTARQRGNDAAVETNLSAIRATSEVFYINNSNSYLPVGGLTFDIATCPTYNASGTNMLSKDRTVADAIAEATKRGINGNSCYNAPEGWAVAVGLVEKAGHSWCVDNSGASKEVSSLPSAAINAVTHLCN